MKFNTLIKEAQELLKTDTPKEVLEAMQIQLEEESDSIERELRAGKRMEDLFTRPGDDPIVRRVITAVFEDMAKSFDEQLSANTRGVGAKYRYILRSLDTNILVATTLMVGLRTLIFKDDVKNSIQRLGSKLGRALVTEVKISQAYKVNPIYLNKVTDRLKRKHAKDVDVISYVYNAAFDAVTLGELRYDLNSVDYLHIGKFGIQAMLDAGLIVADTIRQSSEGKTWNIYNINPVVYDYIIQGGSNLYDRAMSSSYRMMICEPDDWNGIVGGGFKSYRRKINSSLLSIKHVSKSDLDRYSKEINPDKCPKVFNFANRIQKIPFRMRPEALDLISKVLDEGGGMFGVPLLSNPPRPEFPFGEDWDKNNAPENELIIFNNWKYLMTEWYTATKLIASKRQEIALLMKAASKGYSKVYFPVFFDFRGRMYYNANPNPQGTDIARATLEFHDKKPLGSRGMYWLKVHLANCLGYDKTRFDDRVKYVDSIWDKLDKALDDPISQNQAFGDDSPLSAYITALEIRNAYQSGDIESYECGIPVHMDATVSGTQHFSALLRDEVGAEYTNLIDLGGDQKADMYTRVANVTLDLMSNETNPDLLPSAKKWMEFGIPRDLAKRPVMTYTYGVTRLNVSIQITHYIHEVEGTGYNSRFTFKDVNYLTSSLFNAIAETIPATVTGMDFLQDVAREIGNKEICWRTPTGFWVWFDTKVQQSKRIAVRSAGVDLVWMRVMTDETNRRKQISGISPNFIHSMDASHLCMLSNRMLDDGKQLVCIHDSVGTHPCDVDLLHKHIRESFVDLYSDDVLADFKEQVGTSVDLPTYGNFDVKNVLNSEFFFC